MSDKNPALYRRVTDREVIEGGAMLLRVVPVEPVAVLTKEEIEDGMFFWPEPDGTYALLKVSDE